MPRYLMKVKGKKVDYVKIPKGMNMKTFWKKTTYPWKKKKYKQITAPTYKIAIKNFLK